MTEDSIRIVQESFSKLDRERTALVERFYTYLFERFPAGRDLFPLDMKAQRVKFEGMLRFIVHGLSDWSRAVKRIEDLGRTHRRYGAQPMHYEVVAEALVDALRDTFGSDFTPEVEAAWRRLLEMVSRIMLDAQEYGDWPARQESNPFAPIMGVSIERYAVIVRHVGENETGPELSERLGELGLDLQTWDTVRSGWNSRLSDPSSGGIVSQAFVAAAKET